MPAVRAGFVAARAALSAKGTSGARRRESARRTPRSSAPTPRSGRGGGAEAGGAAPKAMLAELSSASATSSQMLRAGRPGHMRSRSLMRRSVFPRGFAGRRPRVLSRHQLSDDAGSPSVYRHSRPPADAVSSPFPPDSSSTADDPLGGFDDHGQRTDQAVRRAGRRRRRLVHPPAPHGGRRPPSPPPPA